jgi:uncharacterized protein YcbK (DUF882 family)
MSAVDWTDPECMVSKYFKVREAIGLKGWGRLAAEPDGLTTLVQNRITKFFTEVVDPLRDFLGKPIYIHCSYRPASYNKEKGGASDSAHMFSGDWGAIDFDIKEPCDDTRAKLLPELESRGLRMEDRPGSDWVHIDNAPVKSHRFFKP